MHAPIGLNDAGSVALGLAPSALAPALLYSDPRRGSSTSYSAPSPPPHPRFGQGRALSSAALVVQWPIPLAMKESSAKVKENRASARQLTRVLLLAVGLELLRPAIRPAPAISHDRATRALRVIATRAPILPDAPRIAPHAIELIEPLPTVAASLALRIAPHAIELIEPLPAVAASVDLL